jgi:CPA2 family monovalent cation:H+ antiporter-2
VTLEELAITVAVLAGLGLIANRFGLSAIPAYLLAGILLGPHAPETFTLVHPSEVTEFVAELGLVFLLFFLGLEFSLERLLRTGRHIGLGGSIDLVANSAVGFVIGYAAFGTTFAAFLVAAAVYVSSSAVAVKGLIDFRRLADDETDVVLGVLLFEDIAIAFVIAIAAGGGAGPGETIALVAKAFVFIGASLAVSRFLARRIDRVLDQLPREVFLLGVFALVVGLAATARAIGLSEAIGALMAGVILSETGARAEIEERFLSFRDLFAALFFFAFGLTIDVETFGSVGWLVAAAVVLTIVGKVGAGYAAGRVGGFSPRQSLNAGAALVAHGEFTIILAQVGAANLALAASDRADLAAFAGLYVLVTATLGIVLMKESKRIGRVLFPPQAPKLEGESL